jgi:molybdate transport system ATP-binding protein
VSIEVRFEVHHAGFRLALELSLPGQGVSALFGPSGCGKTSVLRAIAGLDVYPQGYLRVGGEIWQEDSRCLPPHRRALGYVFQEPSLFPHLSVRGNLEYGLRRVPAAERRVGFDQAVALLGLAQLLERRPVSLSGGECQRVAIARALLASPRLLLMDEPLAALDTAAKAAILPFLERLHAELALPVIYVSHALDEVARLADHLVLMEAGQVCAAGPAAEMLTRLDLPLAHRDGAAAVIDATVMGHDAIHHLTWLDFPGGRFSVPKEELTMGCRVRLQVPARDVSLTLERQTSTSILNIFPARVAALAEEDAARVLVRLEAGGGVPLLARVTRKSVDELGLVVGRQVFAQIKGIALLG